MKLYAYPASPWSRKVMVALAEKDLPYELERVDLGAGEQHRPEILALSPRHMLPVLVDGDLVVRDSTVILEYLDERHPERPLYPRDPAARARVRQAEDASDVYLCGPCFAAVLEKFEANGPCDPARLEALRGKVRVEMDRWSAELGDKEWITGASFSAADCAFMPFVQSFGWADLTWTHANVLAYLARLQARASWKLGREPE